MQLRIQRSAGVLSKRRCDDPLRVDNHHLPTDPISGMRVTFDPNLHSRHRRVVSSDHLAANVPVAEREQHRHRLRGRRGHVEPAHRLVVIAAAQVALRTTRVLPGHQRDERLVGDLTDQTELDGGGAEPDATWFARVQVVVRELLHVVATRVCSLQRGHANSHHTPPHTRVAVHSSINEKPTGRVVDVADMAAYAGNGIDGCSTRVERRTGGRVA